MRTARCPQFRLDLLPLLAVAALLVLLALSTPIAADEGPKLPPPVPPLEAREDAALEADDAEPVSTLEAVRGCRVWLISTRCGAGCGPVPRLDVRRHDDCSWVDSDLHEFHAADTPGVPTVIWIHGNRVSHGEAIGDGWQVYRRLCCQLTDDMPLRFVIWSWPASRIWGQLRDFRVKAARSDEGAYPLAWLIDRIDPAVPVSLIGYSYGARMSTGALHLLGGGRLVGRRLARVHPERAPLRAALLAGALDSHSLAVNARNGRALEQAERVLVTINPCDSVLRFYPVLCGGLLQRGPPAIGYTGAWGYLGEYGDRLMQLRVHVGNSHDWERYVYAPSIMATIADTVLPESDMTQAGRAATTK